MQTKIPTHEAIGALEKTISYLQGVISKLEETHDGKGTSYGRLASAYQCLHNKQLKLRMLHNNVDKYVILNEEDYRMIFE